MNANDIPLLRSIEWLAILCDVLVKGAVLLFAASLITMAMRKASAAARHLVWAIALCGVLVLPLFSVVVPSLRLPILPTFTTVAPRHASASHIRLLPARTPPVRPSLMVTAGAPADHNAIPQPRPALRAPVTPHVNANAGTHNGMLAAAPTARTSSMTTAIAHWMAIRWPLLLLVIWSIGVALIGLVGLMGYMRLAWRLTRARTISTGPIALLAAGICRELKLGRSVQIAIDDSLLIPLAHGVFRPRVLLPSAAESWPSDKLRTVLLHELAHVARWDCASLLFGQIACTLHWPDPLVWVSWRHLRSECERACDDAVLRCSTAPADYAENLLAIARDLRPAALPLPATLAMARPSELKGRIIAILDERRNRRPIPVGRAVGMLLVGTLIVASFAALHLQAKPPVPNAQPNKTQTVITPVAQQKTMTLTVIDKQTGKPLAGVTVKVWNRPALHTAVNGTVEVPVPKSFPKSALSLSVKSPFYVPMELTWNSQNGWAGRIPSRYTLKMWRGQTISGRVVDDSGDPVARAHVVLSWYAPVPQSAVERMTPTMLTVLTNANGIWHCADVPVHSLQHIDIGLWDRNYVSAPSAGFQNGIVSLQRFSSLDKLIKGTAVSILYHGIMVHGTVRGPDGKPVAGADVAVGADRNASNVLPPVITGPHGRFAFAARPNRWGVVLTVTAKGFGPALKHFNVAKGQKPIALQLTSPHTLTGQVVNLAGHPLADTWVHTDTWRGYRTLMHTMRTDHEGRFIWNNAPTGELLLDADSPGYADAMNLPVHTGKDNRIVLRPTLTVLGTVVDAKTGTPIHKFRVIEGSANSPKYPSSLASWDTQSARVVNDDGHFMHTFPFQYAAYAIRIEAKGYRPADSKLFVNNVRTLQLHFRLVRATDILVRVLNPDGTPAAGAKAQLVPAGAGGIIDTGERPAMTPPQNIHTVDSQGRLAFAPTAEGYEIAVYNKVGYADWSSSHPPTNGLVKLKRWGSIRGQVLLGTKPAPGRKVEADIVTPAIPTGPAAPTVQWQGITRTDSKGEFFIGRLPAGNASVAMVGKQHVVSGNTGLSSRALVQRVSVQSGKSTSIRLGGVGRTVDGLIQVPVELNGHKDWYLFPGDAQRNLPPMPVSLKWPMPDDVKHGSPAQRRQWITKFLATAAGKALGERIDRWWQTHVKRYSFLVRRNNTFSILGVVPGTYTLDVRALPVGSFDFSKAVGTVHATFTVAPIPGGVTDIPLKIPPLKLVPVKTAKPADPPALAPAAKTPPAIKTVPAMAQNVAPSAAPTPKTMTLTVIDKQTGKPLAGVTVGSEIDFGGTTKTVTDENGKATIPLPLGHSSSLQIFLKARHYVWQELHWIPHNGNPMRFPASYAAYMPRGTDISGRVVDDAGKPVAGAHVMLWINAKAESPHEKPFVVPINVTTDADGIWHYDGIPATGVTSIGVGVWDYRYVWNRQGFLSMPFISNLTKLRNGTAISTLQRGVMVKGMVLDENKTPVAGASVVLGSDIWGSNTPTPMTTDSNGQFAFAAKPGQQVVVTATSRGHGPALMKFTMGSKSRDITLRLPPPRTLAGKVVNPAGRPLPDATVITDTWQGCRTIIHYMHTNNHGAFAWHSAPTGKILVEVLDNNYASRMRAPVQANNPDNVITLYYSIRVHGTVTNAITGKPIDKFTIIRGFPEQKPAGGGMHTGLSWNRMYPHKVSGDGSFDYTLSTQRPAYAIRIEANGYFPTNSRVFHNSKRDIYLKFALAPAPEITAKVLNPDGSPAAGAKVILIPAGHNAMIHLSEFDETQGDTTARIDADGQMNIVPQKGNYLIVVYGHNGCAILSRSQLPKSGAIHLLKWGHIEGVLLFGTKPGANKKILAYRSVSMVPKHHTHHFTGVSWWVTTRTDSAGRFRISRFPAGKASVQMRISGPLAGGSGALSCPVSVLPGTTVKVTLGGVGQTVMGRVAIPQSLAAIHGWYFEMANADTQRPPWPMPPGIKHGTDAQRSQWFNKFFATATGKAFLARYQLWMRTKFHDYYFVIGADNTFTIRGVIPGIYKVTAVAVNPAVKVPQRFGYSYGTIGTVNGTFTVPPIPGGVTDIPLKIPPLKLVPVKTAKPADPPALAPAAKTPPAVKTVPAMALTAAPTPKTMTLTVIDKQTGKPLAGVKIKVWNGPVLHTTPSGIVEVPLPKSFPKSALSLSVKSPSYVPMELTWNSQNGWAGRIPSHYTLKMWRGKAISGRVDDDAGNPIAGAHVQVWWDFKPQASLAVERFDTYPVWTVTDAQGFWHCAGVPVGHLKAVSLGVWDYNYVWDFSRQTGAFSGWMPLRKFTDFRKLLNGRAVYILQRGVIVHGVVRGPDGKPVPGAKVMLGNDRGGTNVPPPLVADKNGRFAFAVKPGQWVFVTAAAKGYGPILKKFVAGKKPSALSINLTPPHTLTGLVVGPSGRPIAGAWVFTDRWRGCRTLVHTMRTDYEGHFIWNNAPADQIFVNAQSSGYAYTNDVAIRAGDKNRIELQYQVTVHGTVLDARTGKPIHKFQVIGGTVSDPVSPGTAPAIFWNTRFPREVVDDGHFIYRPWGQWAMYAIRIEAQGYGPVDSKLFTNAGRNVYLRFKLMPAKNIAATILNPDGTPAAGAKALLVPAGHGATIGFQPFPMSQGNISSVANHRGLLSFSPQAGDFQIAVYDHDGYAVVTRDNFAKSKFVRLLPWGEIHGRLLFGTKPAPGQTVEINSPAGSSGLAFSGIQWSRLEKTNSKGGFICDQLPAGKISVGLIIWQPGSGTTGFMHGGNLNRTVTVQAGKITELTLGGRGRCVEGRVIIPPTLTHRGHWHFGLASAATKGPALPIPENIRHGTDAAENKWVRAFLKTPKGKAWSSIYDRWAKTNEKFYCFVLKPDGHFLIPDVVPGTYRMSVAVLNGRKPTPMMAYVHIPALATAKATFTVPPIPGGVTDVPLKIPPLKLVPVKTAKAADPPALAPAAKTPPAIKTVPAMALAAAPTPKTMTLTVIDKQTGKPLPGLKVLAIAGISVSSNATTNGDGRVVLTLPKQNSSGFDVIVRASHYVQETLYWGPAPGQANLRFQSVPESYTLALPHGTQISGRVVDDRGTPVSGAHIMLWLNAKSEAPHERPVVMIRVQTKSNGSWHYDGIPAHGVDSIGFGVWDYKYIGADSYVPLRTFRNLSRLRNGTAVFILRRGLLVRGVVRGPNGQPVADAKVALGPDINGDNTPSPITTDATGRFTFAVKSGSRVIATAIATGYGPALRETRVNKRGTTLLLNLKAPHLLMGRVVNTAGQAVAHGLVITDTWRGYRTLRHLMWTDSQGRFDWAEAPAGKILVDVQCAGYAYTQNVSVSPRKRNIITIHHMVTAHGTVVNAKTGKSIKTFTIIRGCIFTPKPNSVPQPQRIYWNQMYPETVAGNGHFIYALPNQRAAYAIRIEANGYLPADSKLFHNNKRSISLRFQLVPSKNIVVTVTTPDGKAAADVPVELVPARHMASIQSISAVIENLGDVVRHTGPDGKVSFPPRKGGYKLVAFTKSDFAISENAQLAKDHTLVLAPMGNIRAKLLFGTKPAPHQLLEVAVAGGLEFPRARTNSVGEVVFRHLPSGRASVSWMFRPPASTENYRWPDLSERVVVRPGQTVSVTLGGTGRPVVGRVIIPAELKSLKHWRLGVGTATNIRTIINPPPLPIPRNVLRKPLAEQLAWYKRFVHSNAYKLYWRFLTKAQRTWFYWTPVMVQPDGAYRIENVRPGSYRIMVDAWNPKTRQDIAMGATQLDIGPIKGGVSNKPIYARPFKLHLIARHAGDRAPDFTDQTINGHTLKLSQFRGKFVVLYFWSDMTKSANVDLHALQQLHAALRGRKNFTMIGVYCWLDPRIARMFAGKYGLLEHQICLPLFPGYPPICSQYPSASLPAIWLIRSLARRNDKTLAVQGFGSFCHFPLLGTLQ